MFENYDRVETSVGPVWVNSSRRSQLCDVDAIVFDCDGVLVDTRRSYDATIAETVDWLLRRISGLELPWKDFAPKLIGRLRLTGAFNNDWDSTYALTIFAMLALPEGMIHWLAESDLSNSVDRKVISNIDWRVVEKKIAVLVDALCSSEIGSDRGWQAVNDFLQTRILNSTSSAMVSKVHEYLGYPGSPPASILSTIFDELYHGSRLFRQMYKIRPRYYRGRGLIENEKLLFGRRDLDATNKLLGRGRLALATGRPYLAAKYVLRQMMNHFDRDASVFIGDMDVNPELALKLAEYRKPSGRSLIHARHVLASNLLLYVGDSGEDVKMFEDAKRSNEPVLFAGIYGADCDRRPKFFVGRDVDLILPTARRIPALLRSMKK
jgi:phosphoglycolate phosphatase-like HAD superfamily hydrolase